ncbi:MAG TPA: galactosyltransferase-related protein [Solirubrobacterales bacterium]|nr:galactosyltransferase-related protein [Solirubrobacterales bacterium]
MEVVVLVPRRPDPWRDRLWRYVQAHLARTVKWPVFEGVSELGPFNRSAAINAAARRSWRTAVVLDADTVIDPAQLEAGVEAARQGVLALPHDSFRSLTRRSTSEVLSGRILPEDAQVRWVRTETKSSCLCIGRDLWEEVGGFDERFRGWGFEDAAFYAACRELAGVHRLKGPVHHLWHPRSREKDPGSDDFIRNRDLADRYKGARGAEMRALLAEGNE